jgi:hypothetical protein
VGAGGGGGGVCRSSLTVRLVYTHATTGRSLYVCDCVARLQCIG